MKSKMITIILTGLLTGTLDALAAILANYKIKAAVIFKFIASGLFGKAAFAGGAGMVLWGLCFHYFIAVSFTTVSFLIYPWFTGILKNKYLMALMFAIIIWLITNLVIIPLSKIGLQPMNFFLVLIGIGILVLTIGLPIIFIANWWYTKKKRPENFIIE
jgi:hypothetical protein